MKFFNLIDNLVRKDVEMARRRTGKSVGDITTPIALQCCIRWLSGGSFHDIRLTAGMSKEHFTYMPTDVLMLLMNVMRWPTNSPLHRKKLKKQRKGLWPLAPME